MSDEFKITATLSLDPSDYLDAMKDAAYAASNFSKAHNAQLQAAEKAAEVFGTTTKEVMKQFQKDQRDAVRAQADAAKEAERIRKNDLSKIESYYAQLTKDFEKSQKEQGRELQRAAKDHEKNQKEEVKQWQAHAKEFEKAKRNAAKEEESFYKQVHRDELAEARAFARDMEKALRPSNGGARDPVSKANMSIGADAGGGAGGMMSMAAGGMSGIFFAGFTMLWDTFKAAASAAWSAVTSAASFAFETIKSIASNVLDGIVDSINRIQHQFKESGTFGSTVDQFQKLEFAASRSGTALNVIESTIRRMESNVGKATFGDKAANGIFDKLGIDVKSLAGQSLTDQFTTINDALQKIENTAQRSALAMQLLGRNGTENMQFLKELKDDSATFDKVMQRISEFDATGVNSAFKAILLVKDEIKNIYDQIASKLGPVISNVVKQMTEWGFTAKNIHKYIDEGFVSLVEFSKVAIQFGMTFAQMWPEIWKAAKNMFDNMAAYIGSLAKSFGEFILKIEPSISTITNIMDGEREKRERAELDEDRRATAKAADYARKEGTFDKAYEFVKNNFQQGPLSFAEQVSGRQSQMNGMANAGDNKLADIDNKIAALTQSQIDRLSQPSMLETLGKTLKDGNIFKDTFAGVTNEFKPLIEDFKEAFNLNDKAAREMVGKLFYDRDNYPGSKRGGNGPVDDELSDEKKGKTNPLGYAINTMGLDPSIAAMRMAATADQSVSDKTTHGILKDQLKAIKQMTPRAA